MPALPHHNPWVRLRHFICIFLSAVVPELCCSHIFQQCDALRREQIAWGNFGLTGWGFVLKLGRGGNLCIQPSAATSVIRLVSGVKHDITLHIRSGNPPDRLGEPANSAGLILCSGAPNRAQVWEPISDLGGCSPQMMNDLLEHGLSPSGGSYREISPGANQGVQAFSTTLYVPGLERKERSAAYRQAVHPPSSCNLSFSVSGVNPVMMRRTRSGI